MGKGRLAPGNDRQECYLDINELNETGRSSLIILS